VLADEVRAIPDLDRLLPVNLKPVLPQLGYERSRIDVLDKTGA
jgi:hypothetical protein